MQIVIDIPETQWDWLHNGFLDEDDGKYAINAILKGTPLPKGHGDLVDRDAIQKAYDYSDIDYSMIDALNDAETIIEADTEKYGINKRFFDWNDEMKYAPTIIEADKVESEEE